MNDDTRQERRRMPRMEGAVARWYARQRRSGGQLATYRSQAAQLTAGLPDGAQVLEVAPGPGYLAVEMARSGRLHVSGLDLSRTFVSLASEYAGREGVSVDFRHGNAEEMPLESDRYDLIICQAAFKNFARPVSALDEMHRVLRTGGTAVIHDMNHDASDEDLDREVRQMALSTFNAFAVRRTFTGLRMRATARDRFERAAAASAFGGCTISVDGITMEVRLVK